MKNKTKKKGPPVYVDLDRRFQPLSDVDVEQLEVLEMFPQYRSDLGWADVLRKRRVVILAEAGSGKSKELQRKAADLGKTGAVSFHATLEDVGTAGLDAALATQHAELAAWRSSDADAWFFLDSIDEAKKARVRLRKALEAIAQGLKGNEGRAYLVLSGRHSDWDFRSDLALVAELLKVPQDKAHTDPVPEISDSSFEGIEDEEEASEEAREEPEVLVMLPLDEARVRKFAQAQGIVGIDPFLAELQRNDLMGLARRPLDLGWLVEYWIEKQRFGTLAEMLQLSLRNLSTEVDARKPAYAPLSTDDALTALKRVGAGLTFQRLEHVLVLDSGTVIASHEHPGLVLNRLLGNLSAQETAELLSRAVFIPVTDGVARLAQDNKGAVRGMLTAQWLKELIAANCPRAVIRNLMFASIYGEDVVIPSMEEAAAWLAIEDADTGHEIVRRDPAILIQRGDPGSLPPAVAQAALRQLVAKLAGGDRDGVSDFDQVRRLVRPEFAPIIQGHWDAHQAAASVRTLLLKCIHQGRLASLVDIAFQAATRFHDDSLTTVFGGRAVLELGPAELVQRYVDHVRKSFLALPPIMVWEVAELHYPGLLSAEDVAAFLATLSEPHSEMHFEQFVKRLEGKSIPLADLSRMLDAYVRLLPEDPDDQTSDDPAGGLSDLCSAFYLKLGDAAVPEELCRAYLITCRYERLQKPDARLHELATATPVRRRALLWAAVDVVTNHPDRGGIRPESLSGLFWAHYRPPLPPEDLDWLVEDACTRQVREDRLVAADAVIYLIARAKDRPELLARAKAAAPRSQELATAISAWETPRVKSPQELQDDAELAAMEESGRLKREANDRSWQEFLNGIKADPSQLRDVGPLVGENIDSRIFHLWNRLSRAQGNRNRYAMTSMQPLVSLVGEQASAYFQLAVARFWRQWDPTPKSERASNERNVVRNFDLIGIAGVSLEAASSLDWARSLSEPLARRAVVYGTLEINGFPTFIDTLATHWPRAVREVLSKELEGEILAQPPVEHLSVLQDVSHASTEIKKLTAPSLYRLLTQQTNLAPDTRTRILMILIEAGEVPADLIPWLLARTRKGKDVPNLVSDLEAIFRVRPELGVGALKQVLARLSRAKSDDLVRLVLSRVVGDGWTGKSEIPASLPFQDLLALMRLAFAHIRVKEDERPDGRARFRSGPNRFDAEHARGSLIEFLSRRPGRATYNALRSLAKDKASPLRPNRALLLARQRAERDAEFDPWRPEDIAQFEAERAFAPRSSRDLCRHAIALLEDLQQDLLNDEFQQGQTLASQKGETAVQNWMAATLRTGARQRFSVERESHVAQEKEPDIRLRVSETQATASVEIKVVESWSVQELESALTDQLVKQYLRHSDHRWGVLLLVHQTPRPRGWRSGRKTLSIGGLIAHLRALADRISGRSPGAPQPAVVLLDVSSLAKPRPKRKKRRRATSRKRPAKSRRKTKK